MGPAAFGLHAPHAWLVRGLVEAGVPEGSDVATGAFTVARDGAVVVVFPGAPGDPPSEVSLHRLVGPDGAAEWIARCPETLLRQAFPEAPLQTLGARVAEHLRAHDAAFAQWRAGGGAPSWAERAGITEVRGDHPPDPAWARALVDLRRQGRSIADGPRFGWWNAGAAAGAPTIAAGRGADRVWNIGPPERANPEIVAHLASLRTAGIGALFIGGLQVAAGLAATALLVGVGVTYGLPSVWAQPSALLAVVFGVPAGFAQIALAGLLRSAKLRGACWALAAIGLLPCTGPCCFVSFPMSAWVMWLLADERSAVAFD